jgi:sporulation protein YlmC with PRC-barrel domain
MTTATGHTSAILASRVAGTKVRDASGESLGEIKDIVLDKTSNNIMFAVVSFGGVLGMGEKFHPLPWNELDYDPSLKSYVIDRTREQLEAAPSGSRRVRRVQHGPELGELAPALVATGQVTDRPLPVRAR